MPPQTLETKSVLGIEIGSVHTRAVLFDVVEGAYHFIASGMSPTTQGEPVFDVGDGIFRAISKLEDVTSHILLDHDGNLLLPSAAGGEGVDRLVVTTSCGPELTMVTFGQLTDVSLESANRLAAAMYGNVAEKIGINDRRPAHVQLDAVITADPDLIIFSGGTDGGANRSVLRMGQLISSILQVSSRSKRPQVLFCGNPQVGKKISDLLDRYAQVKISGNVRPSIDDEVLEPALKDLAEMAIEAQYARVGGLKRLSTLCSTPPMLSNFGLNRVIKFLGRQYDPHKGVLGVDLGASFTTIAYANHTISTLSSQLYGVGPGLKNLLKQSKLEEITFWLDGSRSDQQVQDYLWQKSLYPNSIATTSFDMEIELAAARQVLRLAMRDQAIRGRLPSTLFEPILMSGSTVSHTISPQESLRLILDGIQPLGITPLILDKHGILPMLGAIAGLNPLLAVQVLESTAFINLATVVNVISSSRRGNTLLNARLEYKNGKVTEAEIKQGTLKSMPLASGETGWLTIKPVRMVSIEEINFSHSPVKVSGGVCGVVFDTRGRPIQLPGDKQKGTEILNLWANALK